MKLISTEYLCFVRDEVNASILHYSTRILLG